MKQIKEETLVYNYLSEVLHHPDTPSSSSHETMEDNLKFLVNVSKSAAAGNYDQTIPLTGELSDSVNQMIQSLKSQQIRLDEVSGRDFLTGIGNRLSFDRRIQEFWQKGEPFSVAFIDVDNVKYCNDNHGHQEGDCYICRVTEALSCEVKGTDGLYRIGGDEFVWLSSEHNKEELTELLTKIEQQFEQENNMQVSYPCGFSFGCIEADPGSGQPFHHYLTLADQQMCTHKLSRKKKKFLPNEIDSFPEFSSGLESRVFEALSLTVRNRYIYICNIKTNMSRWSLNAVEDFNLPGEYIYDAGNVWMQCLHPDDRDFYLKDIQAVFSGKKQHHNLEYRVLQRNGSYVICTCQGYMMKDKDGNPEFFAGTISNHGIIDNVDGVTNLYNIYEFIGTVRTLRNARVPVNFLIFGINQFDSVNNAYGYGRGNEVLRSFAAQVSNLLRGKNMVYRLDGVKFVIILRESSSDLNADINMDTDYYHKEAEALITQLRLLAREGVSLGDSQVSLLLSCAMLHFDNLELDESTLMAELNYGLSISKRERDGELVYIDEALHGAARKEMDLINHVKQSVLNQCHGFYLAYQPQVNADRKVIGAEALLRWKDDVWGVVPPGRFIPVLEHDICFYELGLWILKTALQETLPLIREYPYFRVSVNISYRQLAHHNFRSDVMAILTDTHFPPQNLTLELTEHCRSGSIDLLKNDLNFFVSKGIRISADDFGTGFSSLSLLKDLPLQCIKIDQNFVFGLNDSSQNQILVKSMISCAKEFHTEICVEGVETEDVFDFLKQYEPEYYQGYLFSKPCPLDEVKQIIQRNNI